MVRFIVSGLLLGAASPVFAGSSATAYVSDNAHWDVYQAVPGNTPLTYTASHSFSASDPQAPYYDPGLGMLVTPPPVNFASAGITSGTIAAYLHQFPANDSITLDAIAQTGELHVVASDSHPATALHAPDVSQITSSNNYLTSSARFTDNFTVLAPAITNGFAYFTVNMKGVFSASPGSVVIGYVDFDFYDADPTLYNTAQLLGSFSARHSDYGGYVSEQSSFATLNNASPFSGGPDTFGFATDFNHPVYVTAVAMCTVSTATVAVTSAVNDVCDMSHSVYWGGVSRITDGNGNMVAGATIASDSGFDYAAPSPNDIYASPTPEPAAWALLIAGFGLTGVTLRRRRAAFA